MIMFKKIKSMMGKAKAELCLVGLVLFLGSTA